METHTDSGRQQLLGGVLAMAVGTSIVVAAAMAFSPRVDAQDEGPGRIRRESTLRGDYGLLASGVRSLPPVLGGGSEHFVFDGALDLSRGRNAHSAHRGRAAQPRHWGTQFTIRH